MKNGARQASGSSHKLQDNSLLDVGVIEADHLRVFPNLALCTEQGHVADARDGLFCTGNDREPSV